MESDTPECGICGQPLLQPGEADRHRIIHLVPASLAAPPHCDHPPIFVLLWQGLVEIVPLVVDTTSRRVPKIPWASDTLPIPVRRVIEVQNLKDSRSDGPHYPRTLEGAGALDRLYHRLGGPKAPLETVPEKRGPGLPPSDCTCPICGFAVPFNRKVCPGCGEPFEVPKSGYRDAVDYGDYPSDDTDRGEGN